MKLRVGIALLGTVAMALGQDPAAVADYRAGRFDAAHAAFSAEVVARGSAAPAELRADTALAALRLRRAGEAELAAQPLLAHQDPLWRGRGEFLLALAAWQRAERAIAAAGLADAEPMAWDLAVHAAEQAFQHWCRAAVLLPLDLAARRNAERVQRRLAELRRMSELAAAQRTRRSEPEPPPPPPDAPGPAEAATPELVQQPLSAAALARLRAQLRRQELAKQQLRQTAQRRSAVAGERDW